MIESALAYKERDAFEIPENGRLCGVSDNFADAILLGVAWNMGEYGALDTKYNSGGEFGANAGFFDHAGKVEPRRRSYFHTRYPLVIGKFSAQFGAFAQGDLGHDFHTGGDFNNALF